MRRLTTCFLALSLLAVANVSFAHNTIPKAHRESHSRQSLPYHHNQQRHQNRRHHARSSHRHRHAHYREYRGGVWIYVPW